MRKTRINKQVIFDYFNSFFKQYSPLNKEQFNKIRDIVDKAECGCCSVVTIYWVGSNPDPDFNPTPAIYQIAFKDANDNYLAETDIEGTSPQRLCVPREATQLCISISSLISGGGDFSVVGSNGFSFIDTEVFGESCTEIEFPFDDIFIVSAIDA